MREFSFTSDMQSVQQTLAGLKASASDLTDAYSEIGAMLKTSTQMRFENQAGPDGTPWVPAAPSTAREKRKSGHELLLLITGRLKNSIETKADAGGVEIGTNLVYAAIQQFGGTIEREAGHVTILRKITRGELGHRFVKKSQANFASDHAHDAYSITIPARPFVGINNVDERSALDILVKHILKPAGVTP